MSRRAMLAVTIAAGMAVAFLIVLLAASDTQRSTGLNFEILGEVAPQIEGRTLDGGTYDLYAERGKWVVVNFFASWCVGCRVEHPELVDFAERNQGGDVELVAVMFGDTERDARNFFTELGGEWPALVEDTGSIAIDYGVTAVPETVLVSPSGRVVQKWIGNRGVTADELDRAIIAAGGGGG